MLKSHGVRLCSITWWETMFNHMVGDYVQSHGSRLCSITWWEAMFNHVTGYYVQSRGGRLCSTKDSVGCPTYRRRLSC